MALVSVVAAAVAVVDVAVDAVVIRIVGTRFVALFTRIPTRPVYSGVFTVSV